MKLKIITISISVMILSINFSHAAEKKDKNDIYNYDSVLEYSSTYVNKKAVNSNVVVVQTQDMSSNPIRNSYSCESFRGQYDIDSKAVGTFFLITEGNPRNKYYGKIIGSDNSSCYQECTPKTTTETQSCASKNGDGWTGNYTTSTPFSCTTGGYLREGAKTTSNNCVAPVPPVIDPVPQLCQLFNGGISTIGEKHTGCEIYNNHSVRQGLNYTCTASGWENTADKGPIVDSCPDSEPEVSDSICPMVSGLEAKQGRIDTACNIYGSAGVYPQGQNYVCTPLGWQINNNGNSTYMNYCE